ncbi:MAG: nitroreductase family protein, partial [Candidatus Atribacteria bacterium]|nr:nitroreductase family protein [Candidatus Atribacteria bacterium]
MEKTMHDILNLIKTRRSVRKYKSQEVPEECLNKILGATRWSPSAANRQPWRFIVVRDKETRKK